MDIDFETGIQSINDGLFKMGVRPLDKIECRLIRNRANLVMTNHHAQKVKGGHWTLELDDILFWFVVPGDYGYTDGTYLATVEGVRVRVYGEE